jgi:glycosyltransferase involved in cell wall biosynthesis
MLRRIFKKKIFEKVSVSDTDVIVVPHNLGEYRNEIASLTNVVPVIFEFHSTFVEIMSKRHSLGIWVNNIFFFRNLKKYNLVIALTHKDACYWKKYCRNVMSVVNPLSVYNETIPLANKTKGRIIYVGRLHPIKRVDRLVSAFSLISNKYPEWHIDIFGEGSEKTSILSLISDLSLESKIIIHPPVKDIYTEYLKSQMLVLCSDSESFSLVLVEAMSNGLPVISSNCPCGPAEIVENGVTGLLCDMSVEDLAAKMEWMITHEKERIEMGQRAHKAVSRYRKDIIMKEWENAYLSVIQ